MLKTILAATLLAASTSLLAQAPAAGTPPADGAKAHRQHAPRDCSKATDPKACEERQKVRKERHEKMKAAHEQARKSCEGKQGAEHRECMGKSMCAQAPDPAKCEARMKERAQKMKERREAREKKAEKK